jgi:hypothetical protein
MKAKGAADMPPRPRTPPVLIPVPYDVTVLYTNIKAKLEELKDPNLTPPLSSSEADIIAILDALFVFHFNEL